MSTELGYFTVCNEVLASIAAYVIKTGITEPDANVVAMLCSDHNSHLPIGDGGPIARGESHYGNLRGLFAVVLTQIPR